MPCVERGNGHRATHDDVELVAWVALFVEHLPWLVETRHEATGERLQRVDVYLAKERNCPQALAADLCMVPVAADDESGLHLPQLVIKATPREQFLMVALLYHLPLVHDNDVIDERHGREPMGHEHHGSRSSQLADRTVDGRLGFRVERRGHLVQQ